MPRIPSAADVSSVGAAAARLTSVRAGPGDFGLATAGGLVSIGAGVDVLGERLSAEARAEARDEAAAPDKEESLAGAEAKLATAKSKAKARARGQALIAEMKRGDPTRVATVAEAVKRFDQDQVRDQIDLAPTVRGAVKAAVAPVRTALQVRAARASHNLKVARLAADKDETLALLVRQAVEEPKAAELYAAEGLALLSDLRDAGALTPPQLDAESSRFRRGLFTAVIRAQPAEDATADLEAGVYDDALGDPGLKQLLQTETAHRLESERAQQEVIGRWLVSQARRGVATSPFDTAVDAAVASRIELARRVRSELESLRYAPEAALRQGLAALPSATAAGDPETLEIARGELRIQSEAILQERRADPAAFVMGQPAVAKLFTEAGTNPLALPAAVEGRLAAQEFMGLTAEQRNALTKAELAQLLTGLQSLEAAARGTALVELGRLYGDHSARVAAELAEAGHPAIEVSMIEVGDAPATAWRLLQLLEAVEPAKRPEFDLVVATVDRLMAPEQPPPKEPKAPGGDGRPAPSPTPSSSAGSSA